MYFSKDKKGNFEFKKSKAIYSKNKNLTLIARDKDAFDKLKELSSNVILTPDIVFYLNKKQYSNKKREGILFILRNDGEKNISDANIDSIINLLRQDKIKYQISDTTVNKKFICKQEREKLFSKKLSQYSKKQLIITDRLHGMIFAYLTRTPCIVLNNNNGKIKFSYEAWLKDVSFIHFVDQFDLFQIDKKIQNILNSEVDISVDFDITLFNPIKEWAKE